MFRILRRTNMKNKKNLSVAARLAIAFGLVIALLCGSAVLSIVRMAQINAASTDITTNWLPSSIVVSAINTHTSDFRIAEVQHNLSTDEQDMVRYESVMKDIDATIEKKGQVYEKLISSNEERAIWQRFQTAWKGYLDINRKFVALSRANQNDEARVLLRGDSRKLFDEGSDRLLELVALNTKGGQDASAHGDELYAAARLSLIVAAVVAVAVAVLAAALFARWLTRQLGGEPSYVVDVATSIAGGDLARQIDVRQGDTSSIVAAMAAMRQQLSNVVGQVRQASDSIATGSQQIASGTQDLSQRTEEQASNLEETAASMEELTGTVRANADTAEQANKLAAQTSEAANTGGEKVGRVVTTMQGIADSSRRIADIIGVIDGIAFQTNILALNAAVEAARAGEQGRGFAVVASEVRNLAQRSAGAAKEIKDLISQSVGQVEQGTVIAGEAGAAMQDIVDRVRNVSQLIREIAAATTEQSSGIDQVGTAITQMDQVTQQNAALVEESAAAADSLRAQAARLTEVVGVFKLDGSASANAAQGFSTARDDGALAPVRSALAQPRRSGQLALAH